MSPLISPYMDPPQSIVEHIVTDDVVDAVFALAVHSRLNVNVALNRSSYQTVH